MLSHNVRSFSSLYRAEWKALPVAWFVTAFVDWRDPRLGLRASKESSSFLPSGQCLAMSSPAPALFPCLAMQAVHAREE